jgi:hypothetical protein
MCELKWQRAGVDPRRHDRGARSLHNEDLQCPAAGGARALVSTMALFVVIWQAPQPQREYSTAAWSCRPLLAVRRLLAVTYRGNFAKSYLSSMREIKMMIYGRCGVKGREVWCVRKWIFGDVSRNVDLDPYPRGRATELQGFLRTTGYSIRMASCGVVLPEFCSTFTGSKRTELRVSAYKGQRVTLRGARSRSFNTCFCVPLG